MNSFGIFVFAFAYARLCHAVATSTATTHAQLEIAQPPAQELSELAQERTIQQKSVALVCKRMCSEANIIFAIDTTWDMYVGDAVAIEYRA